jgi:hypothetical protein
MKGNYRVENSYGVKGVSEHRTVEAAVKASRKREGEGWVVLDKDGNQWDLYGGEPVVVGRG